MKSPLLNTALSIFICLLASCNYNKEGSIEAYYQAVAAATNSPIIETELLGGFKFGMTDHQVDSVIGALFDKGRLIHFLDAVNGEYGFASVHDRGDFNITNSYYVLMDGDTAFYVDFHPDYSDGKLSGLFCSAECANREMSADEVTRALIRLFKDANADKEFAVFQLPDNETAIIMDNLQVLFFPQPQLPQGSMQYFNMPVTGQLNNN